MVRFSEGHCQTTTADWCYETLENKPIKPEETRLDLARKLGSSFLSQNTRNLLSYES